MGSLIKHMLNTSNKDAVVNVKVVGSYTEPRWHVDVVTPEGKPATLSAPWGSGINLAAGTQIKGVRTYG